MTKSRNFYENLHGSVNFSAGEYDIDRLLKIRALRQWLDARQGGAVSILDVGCGKGLFLSQFRERLEQNLEISADETVGIDLIESPGNLFPRIGPGFRFIEQNIDNQQLKVQDVAFDIVLCNHVLEHIFETEQLVKELWRAMKPDGICIISLPNLAAWINRMLLLLGIQPLGTEVGTDSIAYGAPNEIMKGHLEKFTPSGHIRPFTPRALRDMLELNGFSVVGWWNQDKRAIFRATKFSGRGIGAILAKK